MRARAILAASVLALSCVLLAARGAPPTRSASPDLLYTATSYYDLLAWIHGGDRFPIDASIMRYGGQTAAALVPSFAASADPEISFSGDRVLFAGKQSAQDRWQIWEIVLESGAMRQLTSCADGCIRPLYLPEDRFVYAERVDGQFALQVAPLAGGKSSRLTFAPGNHVATNILRDGRILFEASYPTSDSNSAELYTVYSDGSGVESYRCDHAQSRHSGRQLSSGDVLFATAHGLGRFTSGLAQQIAVSAPSGEYAGDIAEQGSGDWLMARRRNSQAKFRLESWGPGTHDSKVLIAEDSLNLIQPVLVQPRGVPNRHPSALHDWDYANLLCLNSYTSKYKFADQSVATVRVYTHNADGSERLLGTAPVETDGSFYIRTPADQPLKIELLDPSGKSLKKEAGWFWLRRGEQRVCVGCHAGPETAPENRTPAVLKRSTLPADLTHPAAHEGKGGR